MFSGLFTCRRLYTRASPKIEDGRGSSILEIRVDDALVMQYFTDKMELAIRRNASVSPCYHRVNNS
jgi:hypothetical protein